MIYIIQNTLHTFKSFITKAILEEYVFQRENQEASHCTCWDGCIGMAEKELGQKEINE